MFNVKLVFVPAPRSSKNHKNSLKLGMFFFVLILMVFPFFISGCTDKTATLSNGVIKVVACENFWGSIAAQLGGSHVNVTNIISNPDVDPHAYESNAANARSFARANYVILNGAGYDSWGLKLLNANPVNGRKLLNIADLLGEKEGDNPHFWYDPDYLNLVINQITSDYNTLYPQYTEYFSEQEATFKKSLSRYYELISSIKQTYSGVKVGATESIFVYLSNALGLDLISPPAFMNAISEGNEPPASSVALFHQEITNKQIAMLVYNMQTVNTITTGIKQLAAKNNIPTVGITETVMPPDAPFQDWQVTQLLAIQNALKSSN